MAAVILCCWNLRRLFRERVLVLLVVPIPALAAVFCGRWFADSTTAKWFALASMAMLSAALVYRQAAVDSALGLSGLVRSLRTARWLVECAWIASFAALLTLEVLFFLGIRSIVYGK